MGEEDETVSSSLTDEVKQVRKNRIQEAVKAGLTKVEAQLFADSDSDVGLLRQLVKGGATPDQIRRVLL